MSGSLSHWAHLRVHHVFLRVALACWNRSRRQAHGSAAAALACVALVIAGGCATDQINSAGPSVGAAQVGTNAQAIVVGGLRRTFLLHVPIQSPSSGQDVDALPGTSYPLVLVLHGSSGDGESIREASRMDSLADARGFLVVYPDGSDGGFGLYPTDWNAGTCCGAPYRQGIDDLAFLDSLINRISSELPVDPSRIYIAGFSDGGRMAYHVACQLATKIAAIGVVSGSIVDDSCAPAASVAVLAIHGTADDEVPYDAAAASSPLGPVPDMAADLPSSVQFWIAANGCGNGTVVQVADDVVRASFDSCSGADVAFYTIEGGVHGWPGEPGSSPVMSEVGASGLIADFFANHVRR